MGNKHTTATKPKPNRFIGSKLNNQRTKPINKHQHEVKWDDRPNENKQVHKFIGCDSFLMKRHRVCSELFLL